MAVKDDSFELATITAAEIAESNERLITSFFDWTQREDVSFDYRRRTKRGLLVGWWHGGAGSRTIEPEHRQVPVYMSPCFRLFSPGFKPPKMADIVRIEEAIQLCCKRAGKSFPLSQF